MWYLIVVGCYFLLPITPLLEITFITSNISSSDLLLKDDLAAEDHHTKNY
jgi:hypothetical protein